MNTVKIGNLISELRKEKKLTQSQLGKLLGVSDKTVSKWECGNGVPDITILHKICEILGISIDELLAGEVSLLKQESRKRKINLMVRSILIFGLFLIIGLIVLVILKEKPYDDKVDNDCTVIRTYYIDNINESNEDNYLYITVHEFQVEGTFTLKLSKLVSVDLEIGDSYEFTFRTSRDYLNATTDILFNNSEIINIEYSDKIGLDRTSTFYCD